MKPLDFLKSAGVALALLALNVLIAILVVTVYRFGIEPGQPDEFYDAAVLRIAPWCSHVAGTALFFGAGYLFARVRPDRNGFVFALVFTVSYAVIDSATVGFAGALSVEFGLSMLAKLAAGQAGALVAGRRSTRTPAVSREN